ncbi:MAG TPA: AI-2E family transporter, partial [Ktedonobacteraceae bacterium]|nr:AI-2E family transporter [Ktedonobacteraceae bacterium]
KTLLMVIIAALLAFALAPAVTWLERFVPRVLAILFVYLIALVGLFALFYMIVISAIDQVNAIAIFLSHQNWSTWLALLQPLGITAADVQKQISALQGQLLNTARDAAGSVVPLLTGVADALLNVVIVAVLSIYFLIDGQRVTAWLRRNAPVSLRRQTRFTLDTLNRVVGGYIRGQLLLCTLIGVLVGVGMAIFHVPYALLLGVLAFLLEFIPILGTLVSGAICVLLALTQGWFIAVLVLAYFIGVHILEGDIIGPRLVGKAIGLHPIVSIAALIAGAELFGIWGALFASPVAGLLQALLVALWLEWRARQPHEFATAKAQAVDAALETTAHPTAPEPEGTHASD